VVGATVVLCVLAGSTVKLSQSKLFSATTNRSRQRIYWTDGAAVSARSVGSQDPNIFFRPCGAGHVSLIFFPAPRSRMRVNIRA
jgi:hypothetical protein